MSGDMDWTAARPTSPGYYWIMDGPDDEPTIIDLRGMNDVPAYVPGRIYYGPLTPPD